MVRPSGVVVVCRFMGSGIRRSGAPRGQIVCQFASREGGLERDEILRMIVERRWTVHRKRVGMAVLQLGCHDISALGDILEFEEFWH